jgi:branched-chain amino acid transport system permease protein
VETAGAILAKGAVLVLARSHLSVSPFQDYSRRLRIARWLGGTLVLAALVLLPNVASEYQLHIAVLSLAFLLPALGLNLILGYTGLFSLAQAAFYGTGAYTTALIAIHLGWPFWLTFLSTGLLCTAVALLMAIPALTLRRDSFVMITLGYVVIGRTLAKNWVSLTRGDQALVGIPPPILSFWGPGFTFTTVGHYYYLALAAGLVGVLLFYLIISSPAGRCLMAIRDDDTLAESYGVNVWRYKVIVFALSASFAGLGGGVEAYYTKVVSPEIFDMYYILTFLIIVFAGGAGTFSGILLGTAVFVAIPEALRIAQVFRMLVYGLLLTVLVFIMPSGLSPLIWSLGKRLFVRLAKKVSSA